MSAENNKKAKIITPGERTYAIWLGRISLALSALCIAIMLFLWYCFYFELYSLFLPCFIQLGWLCVIFVVFAIPFALGYRARLGKEASSRPLHLSLLALFMIFFVPSFLPPLGSAREKPRRISCISNLKQIGMALDAYAKSNNGYFPSGKGVAGMEMLRSQSYISDYKLFICPSTGAASGSDNAPLNDANCLYVYSGAGLSTKDSSDSPILMDKPDNHTKYGNILFVDGHVRGFTGSNWQNAGNSK